jgi:tetratricopeptide (TPR) repeat protein
MLTALGGGGGGSAYRSEDELEKFRGALFKRKDFIALEEEARLHPARTYYFRQTLDSETLVEAATKKLSMDPLNVKARTLRALALLKRKDYQGAVVDLTAVLGVVPDDVSALFNRGMAQERLGATNEAIADYTRVLLLSPSHVNAAYARAACYNRKGQFSEAIEDYNLALAHDKGKPMGSGRAGPGGGLSSISSNGSIGGGGGGGGLPKIRGWGHTRHSRGAPLLP